MEYPRLTPSTEVLAHRFQDALVLVHLGTSQFYEMNATGARLWELLAEGKAPGEAARSMQQEYAVDADVLSGEIETLLGQLKTAGLVCEVH